MRALLPACLLLALACALRAAPAERLECPEVYHAWASEPKGETYRWDEAEGRLAVVLLYAAAPETAAHHAEPAQSLRFHFPRVRRAGREFVLDRRDGRTARVAEQWFLGGVHLARGAHLIVARRHGLVRVALDVSG